MSQSNGKALFLTGRREGGGVGKSLRCGFHKIVETFGSSDGATGFGVQTGTIWGVFLVKKWGIVWYAPQRCDKIKTAYSIKRQIAPALMETQNCRSYISRNLYLDAEQRSKNSHPTPRLAKLLYKDNMWSTGNLQPLGWVAKEPLQGYTPTMAPYGNHGLLVKAPPPKMVNLRKKTPGRVINPPQNGQKSPLLSPLWRKPRRGGVSAKLGFFFSPTMRVCNKCIQSK